MSVRQMFENVLKKRSPEETLIDFLQSSALFAGLSKKEARFLSELFHCRTYQNGEVIFDEGQDSSAMYLVLRGRVEVRRDERSIIQLERGDFFGEVSLFDEHVRSATVVALEAATQLLVFSKGDLEDVINRDPALANKVVLRIAQVLAKRLRRMNETADQIKRESVEI